ncbi:MAG: discoidin domain-containing protein [Gammaproteobacteria bacterium]|nr:discoidin domain-containing protein [Gammaproteobacteria bacterium]
MADITWFRRTLRVHAVIVFSVLIAACGGGEDEASSGGTGEVGVVIGSNTPPPPADSDNNTGGQSTVVGVINETPITITGTVIDGPVTDAIITIRDANDAFVATTRSDSRAHYRADIPANSIFPLTLTATGGTNIVNNAPPSFTLISAITSPDISTANLNPYSTLIVNTARRKSGGLTPANLASASESILTIFNAGLNTDLMPNPITTPVTDINAASVIKSSEAIAETIRRNQRVLEGVIVDASADTIINSLSADMTDGTLDGVGVAGSDPRVSSVSSITFGQVLIESISNGLEINDELASDSLSNAVSVTFPTSVQDIEELPITMGALSNIRTAVAAAALVAPSIAMADLESATNGLNAGSLPSEAVTVLPAESGTIMNEALNQINGSDGNVMNLINALIGTAYAADAPAEGLVLLNITAVDASSHDADRERIPENAIDGNLDSKWTALSMPQWFTADLGATQSVSHLRMKINVNNNGANASYAIDVSRDNTSWTNVLTNVKPVAVSGWVSAELPAVTARYVRIRLNSSNASDYTNLYELELYGQVLPANIASVSASDYDAERARAPSLATDGNLTSKWTALSLPQWLMVDLGTVQSISGINMKVYIADAGRNANYSVDVSSDRSTWATVIANSSIDTTTGWAQASFIPVSGRYVRLRLDSTNTSDYVNLSEIMVYAQAAQNPASSPTDEDISNVLLTLTWQPNVGSVQGYKVFFGPTPESVSTEISDITNTLSTSFNPAIPAIAYDSWYTLRLLPGDNVCFRVRAYNADGLSNWSLPICGTITEAAG